MSDILLEQAAIKGRRSLTRDTSGQFIRPDKALAIKVAADRMKASLKREVEARDHARGVAYVHPHFRPLPNADKLALVETPASALPLFELEAA